MKVLFPCYCLETLESARRLPNPVPFRRFAVGLLWSALFAVFGLAPSAFADSTWSNTGTGSWADAANWIGGAPGSNDDAEVNNGGIARLETGVSGNPFSVLLGGALGGSSGSLEIAGGTLTAYNAYIAYSLGSTGNATVTDGGSWSNSSSLSLCGLLRRRHAYHQRRLRPKYLWLYRQCQLRRRQCVRHQRDLDQYRASHRGPWRNRYAPGE